MKRFVLPGIILFLVLLITGYLADAMSVVGTKHDLSYRVSGTIQYMAISADPALGGTSQVCIFCHTPHGGNSDAPLWNKSVPSTSYNVYQSDVLSALGITAENPSSGAVHVKSRICLSCHDGTVALGSVANLPADIPKDLGFGGYSQIRMASGATNMQSTSAGYMGVDLRDDHPVAIKHAYGGAAGQDPELLMPPTGSVRLYNIGSGGRAVVKNPPANGDYVECTSCHNAHDNASGYFLIEPNTGSALCRDCHRKYGADQGSVVGIHSRATLSYIPPSGSTPPAPIGTTVGGVQCMSCHYMHKSGVLDSAKTTPNPSSGKYLLSYQEEQSCFNNQGDRWNGGGTTVCHGSMASNPNTRISPDVSLTSAHRVGNYQNVHNATEGAGKGWIATTPWHVECQDCHNAHTAGTTVHSEGSNSISSDSSLYGAAGVVVVPPAPTWTNRRDGSYSYFEPYGLTRDTSWPATQHYEYEICLRCHSDWAWGNGAIPSYSRGGNLTNQALEFGGNSTSHHPVMRQTGRNVGSLTSAWINMGIQTMYCSDCHTKGSILTRPLGPHGTNNSPILRNSYVTDYGARGGGEGQKQPSDLCMDCHSAAEYLTTQLNRPITGSETGFRSATGINLHTQHAYRSQIGGGSIVSPWPYRCVDCHTRVSHGFNRRAMITILGDGFPYEAAAGGGKITAEPILSAPYSGGAANCSTVAGCHTN